MGIPDPEGSRARLEAWRDRIDQLAADTQAMSDRFQALTVSASDPDELVRVTVDSSGSLIDLVLSERTRRIETERTAAAVLAAVRAANGRLADRSVEIISETLGEHPAARRAIADRARGQVLRDPNEES